MHPAIIRTFALQTSLMNYLRFLHTHGSNSFTKHCLTDLCFPEGIRFEDLPVAYLLAVKARSIGYVDRCFYNYIQNVGFLSRLTPSTLHIRNAIICYEGRNGEAGAVRAVSGRNWISLLCAIFLPFLKKLLTNYETNQKED